ncbi:hypothetical protein CPB84DRAFT_1788673 [Gymnopilus junonius]|uniref:Uncharacterized protein n=1 Tax=Gymnopilus junonius TaxID=109634 RepID=A0A9P5NE78_GYMJU|nr:hypothetical protein CPB84DRAFT_1788673 [Gymnopilus junonius]
MPLIASKFASTMRTLSHITSSLCGGWEKKERGLGPDSVNGFLMNVILVDRGTFPHKFSDIGASIFWISSILMYVPVVFFGKWIGLTYVLSSSFLCMLYRRGAKMSSMYSSLYFPNESLLRSLETQLPGHKISVSRIIYTAIEVWEVAASLYLGAANYEVRKQMKWAHT